MADEMWMWMSFVDDDRPKGERFLGVAVVHLTGVDLVTAKAFVDERYPDHLEGAEIVYAAATKAHLTGCNPGGEIMSYELTADYVAKLRARGVPLHTLLSTADLTRFLGPGAAAPAHIWLEKMTGI